jgi:hypothetical protein
VEKDFKAWNDLMRRFNHMFHLGLDLSDLDQKSAELLESMDTKIREVDRRLPQLKVREYMDKVAGEFTERPFMPLSDVWERELRDLFEDLED